MAALHTGTAAKIVRLLVLIGGLTIIVKGFDYVTGSTSESSVFELGEGGILLAWGATCLLSGVLMVAGSVCGCTKGAALGTLMATIIYLLFVGVTAIAVLKNGWPWDDYGYPADHLGNAISYGVITWWLVVQRAVEEDRKGR